MPELPEVQTIVNDLQLLTGDTITGFWSNWGKSLSKNGSKTSEKKFAKNVVGAKIESISRKGKFVLITLSNDMRLAIHLRMTGQLLLTQNFQFPTRLPDGQVSNFQINSKNKIQNNKQHIESKHDKHIHHAFILKKNGVLAFSDVRKFGTLNVVDQDYQHPYFKAIDPFDEKFTLEELTEILSKNKKRNIKTVLLDQKLIAGIGNIYASEILFSTGISPLRNAASLSQEEVSLLYKKIREVLKKAIRMRGTSVSDYRDSSGKKGRFQNALQVYKRSGLPCKKCATIIASTRIGQRSTFYCPKCQSNKK